MLDFFFQHTYLIGLVSFVVGLIFMPVVLRIAQQKHFVVRPNKRMSHIGEIPNIGGLDICLSFMLTYMLFEFNHLQQSQFLLIGLFTIMVVGFIDDILVLSPLSKLLCEMFAGISLIGFADIRITHLHGIVGITDLPEVASYCISFFILVAIINAINLIDGVDGLASGLGMIYCLFFAVYFDLAGEKDWSILAICMIGSLAVFFTYNVFGGAKRKIFMGDSGSLLLGYIISSFVFRFCEINAHQPIPEAYQFSAAPIAAICVLTIPIFDTIRVSLTRIKHKKSPFLPDKNHIHHLLLKTGINHIQTTCILLFFSLLFIAITIIGRQWNMWLLLFVDFAIATILTIILWRIIDHVNKKNNTHPTN